MKNFWFGVGATILIFLFGWFLTTQNILPFSFGQKRTITVLGEGKVKIKPEVVRFTVGVSKSATTVSEAMTANQQVLDNVMAALKSSGINQEDIKTSNYSVWPEQSQYYEEGVQKSKVTGYRVSNDLSVTLRQINQVSNVLAKVLEAEATNIGGVYFTAEDPKEPEKEARKLAIDEAYIKAKSMAEASKTKVGKLVSLSEGTNIGVTPVPVRYEDGGGGGPSIEPGQLEISQTITAVFELK